jgi:hypothetical protein
MKEGYRHLSRGALVGRVIGKLESEADPFCCRATPRLFRRCICFRCRRSRCGDRRRQSSRFSLVSRLVRQAPIPYSARTRNSRKGELLHGMNCKGKNSTIGAPEVLEAPFGARARVGTKRAETPFVSGVPAMAADWNQINRKPATASSTRGRCGDGRGSAERRHHEEV